MAGTEMLAFVQLSPQRYYQRLPSTPAAAHDPRATARNATKKNDRLPSAMSSASTADLRTAPNSFDSTGAALTQRHGRLFLRDPTIPYPLPCDIPEIHRQSLRSLMLMRVFGSPFCAPYFDDDPPKRVLEIACGAGVWSTACRDYFARDGHTKISFTGLDIVSIAPDLKKQGLDWHFVQHDMRRPPYPFPDNYFDFIFIKDTGLCTSAASLQAEPLSEPLRVLKSGGTLEVWDSDYIFRTLLPDPPAPPGLSEEDIEQAETTATYTISAATPFATAQNTFLRDYNAWAQKVFDKRKLTGVPCAFIGHAFAIETDSFRSYGSRRIAVPLGEVRWEREATSNPPAEHHKGKRSAGLPRDGSSQGRKGGEKKTLNEDQLALRHTALLTIIQMIESLEPMLRDASGKSRDEWDRWWSSMRTDLLQQKGAASGECLEVGAWWGQKR